MSTSTEAPDELSTTDLAVLRDLRSRGFAVIIWTPDELDEVDIDELESIAISRGNDYISDCQQDNGDND